MLSFKNPFTKSTPAPEPPDSSASAEDLLKGKQLLKVRTKARVESLEAELEAARRALSQQERHLGELLVDELDTTAAAESFKQANDHIRTLEAAVAVATEKDNAAQAELQRAECQVADAAQEAARQALLELAQEGEEIFIRVKLLRAEVVRQAAAAREVGGIEDWGQRESVDYLSFFLSRANRSAAADAADSGAFMKYPSWTYCLRYVCGKVRP